MMAKRCALPQYLSDNLGLVLSNPDMQDVRIRRSRHLMFNLSRPESSLILLAPLSRNAGGYAACRSDPRDAHSGTVFSDTSDPDFRTLLALCQAGRRHLESITRFDMPGFRPTPSYLREMRRYGVLNFHQDPTAVDVYALDRAYWETHWWQPITARAQ